MKHKLVKLITVILIAARLNDIVGQAFARQGNFVPNVETSLEVLRDKQRKHTPNLLRPVAKAEREGGNFDREAFVRKFKEQKIFVWNVVPEEKLKYAVSAVFDELATALGKPDASSLTAYDMGRGAIIGTDNKPRTLKTLVRFIMRRDDTWALKAVDTLGTISGVRLWKKEDWAVVSEILNLKEAQSRETITKMLTVVREEPGADLRDVAIPLSAEQENRLFEEVRNGNRAACEALFCAYYNYIYNWVQVVIKIEKNAGKEAVQLDETVLMNLCEERLVEAVLYFDPARGKTFREYLKSYYLYDAARDARRDVIERPEVQRGDKSEEYKNAQKRYSTEIEDIDLQELCLDVDVDVDWLKKVVTAVFEQLRVSGRNDANKVNEDIYFRHVFGSETLASIGSHGVIDADNPGARKTTTKQNVSQRFERAQKIINPYLEEIEEVAHRTRDMAALEGLLSRINGVAPRARSERQSGKITRRGFIGKALGAAAGLYLGAQPAKAASKEAAGEVNFSSIADRKYLRDSLTWIHRMRLEGAGVKPGLHGLWQSFGLAAGQQDEGDLAKYNRTWVYDDALAIYALLNAARLSRDAKTKRAYLGYARDGVAALVGLARWEQARGFNGLWHFSYNASKDDSFIHPWGPQGANLWCLSAIFAYTLESRDTAFLDWANSQMKGFIFKQQVMDEKDPRYGLIMAGLYNKADYEKNDKMGYGVHNGDPNVQHRGCFTEHNADYAATLRLAALAAKRFRGKREANFIGELNRRHELCLKSVVRKFWRGDHFCTGMDEDGTVNTSVAVDNNTWLADIIMPYDMERAWKCIEFVRDKFRVKLTIRGREVSGLIFFEKGFRDPFVKGLSLAEREKLTKMIQPEGTFGYIVLLMRYAQLTDNQDRRNECLRLIKELYASMAAIKNIYAGDGTPYATAEVRNLFTQRPAMAPTALAAIVTAAMLKKGGLDDFIGVKPPQDFTIDGKGPYHRAIPRAMEEEGRRKFPLTQI